MLIACSKKNSGTSDYDPSIFKALHDANLLALSDSTWRFVGHRSDVRLILPLKGSMALSVDVGGRMILYNLQNGMKLQESQMETDELLIGGEISRSKEYIVLVTEQSAFIYKADDLNNVVTSYRLPKGDEINSWCIQKDHAFIGTNSGSIHKFGLLQKSGKSYEVVDEPIRAMSSLKGNEICLGTKSGKLFHLEF